MSSKFYNILANEFNIINYRQYYERSIEREYPKNILDQESQIRGIRFKYYREDFLNYIKSNSFSFEPFKQKQISRGGKKRTISLISVEDKFVDYIIFKVLNRLFHLKNNPNIYDITYNIKLQLKKKGAHFLRVDIQNYIDTIDHKVLKAIIGILLLILNFLD